MKLGYHYLLLEWNANPWNGIMQNHCQGRNSAGKHIQPANWWILCFGTTLVWLYVSLYPDVKQWILYLTAWPLKDCGMLFTIAGKAYCRNGCVWFMTTPGHIYVAAATREIIDSFEMGGIWSPSVQSKTFTEWLPSFSKVKGVLGRFCLDSDKELKSTVNLWLKRIAAIVCDEGFKKLVGCHDECLNGYRNCIVINKVNKK